VPRPFGSIHLPRELLRHDLLGIHNIQVGEVDQAFPDRLVQLDGIGLLDELTDDLALVVLHNEHFLRPDHLLNHHHPQI
jgi:hypothetical protein